MRTNDILGLAPYYEARSRMQIALGELREFARLRNRREDQWARIRPAHLLANHSFHGAAEAAPDVRYAWVQYMRDRRGRRMLRAVRSKMEHTQPVCPECSCFEVACVCYPDNWEPITAGDL